MDTLLNSYNETHDSVDLQSLSRTINLEHRNAVLKWLMESLDLLKIEDRMYFSTLTLADRYCSRVRGRWELRYEGPELQLVLLASLCCSLKTTESSLTLSVKSFLEHVSGGHVSCRDIFAAETRLLQLLDFNVFTPSVVLYLEGYYYQVGKTEPGGPLEQNDASQLPPQWIREQYNIALFLLYLSSLHIHIIHGYRHPSVLASACILTAAFNLQLADVQHELPQAIASLSNMGLIDREKDDVERLVRDMSDLWRTSVESAPQDPGVAAVFNLFGSDKRMNTSKISPRSVRPVHASGG